MPEVNNAFRYVNEYPNMFKIERNILFCNFCCVNVLCNRQFQSIQHFKTTKHTLNCRLKAEKNIEPFIKKTFNQVRANNQNTNEFNIDLCYFMVANDISLF